MYIKAFYEDDQVILNTDFIVDIFRVDGENIAYTLDNERGGYTISDEDVKKLQEGE